jgi:hypothetical protein
MSAYKICKLLISIGRTAGLQTKVNMFYACNQLTDEEYTELTNALTPATTTTTASGDSTSTTTGGSTGTSGQ